MIPSQAFLERFTTGGAVDKTYGVGGTANYTGMSIAALAFDSRGRTLAAGTGYTWAASVVRW